MGSREEASAQHPTAILNSSDDKTSPSFLSHPTSLRPPRAGPLPHNPGLLHVLRSHLEHPLCPLALQVSARPRLPLAPSAWTG